MSSRRYAPTASQPCYGQLPAAQIAERRIEHKGIPIAVRGHPLNVAIDVDSEGD